MNEFQIMTKLFITIVQAVIISIACVGIIFDPDETFESIIINLGLIFFSIITLILVWGML
jgi:hypothetical protein